MSCFAGGAYYISSVCWCNANTQEIEDGMRKCLSVSLNRMCMRHECENERKPPKEEPAYKFHIDEMDELVMGRNPVTRQHEDFRYLLRQIGNENGEDPEIEKAKQIEENRKEKNNEHF